MATKLDAQGLSDKCARSFFDLAYVIEDRHNKKLAYQWIRKEFTPRMEAWRDAEPALYLKNKCTYDVQTITISGTTLSLPKTMDWPRYIPTDLVTMDEIVAKYATDEQRDEMLKAKGLKEKGEKLQELLHSFLEGFTSVEQAIFSLPELKSFAPVKCASQKRPRFFRVPSNELRQLMMEAARLKEALAAQGGK